MRIYEIAREIGVTSVEVLKAAEAAGMEATSAISSVNDGEAAALKAAISKDAGASRVAKRSEKRNLAAELNAKFFAEQRAKLERHLAIAKAAAEGKPVPACAYCRSLADVPASGVGRLVLPGRQGERFLALYRNGRAPAAREIAFVSPTFAPGAIPQTLFASTGVGVLLGEFAARYVDVYGAGPHPKWVTVVKGAELYIPGWTDYVIGGGR